MCCGALQSAVSQAAAVGSLEGDGGAGSLEGLLGLLGVFLRSAFEDGLGGSVDEVLGFLQSERGQSADLLMTGTFFSPADSRLTAHSVCSSAGAAPPPPAGAAATAAAAGAAASTSNSSSNFLTNSESSMRVSSLKASMSSSVVSLA